MGFPGRVSAIFFAFHMTVLAGVDFDRSVRPVLSDSCFQCHGPDEVERKGNLRLDTREGLLGATSEIIERITSTDPDEKMPPPESGLSLDQHQVELIRNWVSEGADWQQHWSLALPVRPDEPEVSLPNWANNPIDLFILAKLEEAGLKPSPEADSRLLARRLYFDITGLPPSPEEVEEFIDSSIQTAVKRLLQSPAYGEKMAIRWLDAARYADTNGYQNDGWRDMWRWRDWVISAYNRNQPFDRFTIEQLAGDLLPNPTLEQKIATAFNRNHRGNAEGGIVPEEYQVEYVVDRVDTTFAVWQGLTMGCARCHSHKYDPISQRDYYQVFAAFNNLPEYGRAWKEGNSEPMMKAPTPQQTRRLQALKDRENAARAIFDQAIALPPKVRAPVGWTIDHGLVFKHPRRGGMIPPAQASAPGTAEFSNKGNFGYFDAFSLVAEIVTKPNDSGTILSKMVLVNEGSGYSLHLTPRGTLQANFVKRWLDDSVRVETVASIGSGPRQILVTYGGTRRAKDIHIYIDGKPVETKANHDFLNQTFAVDEPLRIGQGNSTFSGTVKQARLYDRILEPEEILALTNRGGDLRDRLYAARESFAGWKQAKHKAILFEASIPGIMVMSDSMPRQTRVLTRGQYDLPGEPVEPGVPSALPPLPEGEPANRLGIAKWLVSGTNPLTARVTVNRIWRDIFGNGLVKSTEDFGVQGERPSHPKLLDWLAVELVESGWDLQHVIELIVTSRTYRQTSRVTPELLARDPENRLLARGPRFRLPAEMIRDQALAVSGLLHHKVGGPSVKPYQPAGLWKDIASDSNYVQAQGHDLYRRSLYTYWKRTVPPPMMVNFDASGREACDVALRRTNTPLQALNLMNEVTFVEAARVLAQSSIPESTSDQQILNRLFLSTLSRTPESKERRLLLNSKNVHFEHFTKNSDLAEQLIAAGEYPLDSTIPAAELAAWTMIGNTLLNLDESVTKE